MQKESRYITASEIMDRKENPKKYLSEYAWIRRCQIDYRIKEPVREMVRAMLTCPAWKKVKSERNK